MRRLGLVLAAIVIVVTMIASSGLSASAQMAPGGQGDTECAPWTWDYFYSSSVQRWYFEWWRWCWNPAQGWFQDFDGWDWL
jgi:hypothetical protein